MKTFAPEIKGEERAALRVSGSIRTKTYGSAVRTIFQSVAAEEFAKESGSYREAVRHDGTVVQQLSRKERLNGRDYSPQVFEKTKPSLNIFPKETYSRESVLLIAPLSHDALP